MRKYREGLRLLGSDLVDCWRLGRLALLFGRAVWPAAWSVAVTEALEVVIVIRAVLGAQNPGAVSAPLKALERRRNVGKRFKTGPAPFRRR